MHLPTLGRLRVGDSAAATLAVLGEGAFEVRAASGKWHVEPGYRRGGRRTGSRSASCEPGNSRCGLRTPTPTATAISGRRPARLAAGEAAAWQAQFEEAWRLIEQAYPRYAPGVAAGLTTLLPLANDVPGREISAAARQAFGAVAAALPGERRGPGPAHHPRVPARQARRADSTCSTCATGTDQRVFFAPWREDPRPLGALLQGTYAHIAVTDYWRVRRTW